MTFEEEEALLKELNASTESGEWLLTPYATQYCPVLKALVDRHNDSGFNPWPPAKFHVGQVVMWKGCCGSILRTAFVDGKWSYGWDANGPVTVPETALRPLTESEYK